MSDMIVAWFDKIQVLRIFLVQWNLSCANEGGTMTNDMVWRTLIITVVPRGIGYVGVQ